MVRRVPSGRGASAGSSAALPGPLHRRLGFRLESVPARRPSVRLVVSVLFDLFDQPQGTSCGALRCSGFPSSASVSLRVPLCGQHDRSVVSSEARRDAFCDSQLSSPVDPSPLRAPSSPTGSAVHSGETQCISGFSESSLPGPRLGMNLVSSGIPVASSSLACDHRPLRDLDDGSPSGVLCSDGRSSVSGHRRHDAVVGRPSGLCLPSLRPSASCAVEGPAVQGSGAQACGSILAPTPLVSRPSGASGGCSSVPPTAEGSSQTAALPSLSPEPPRASTDCLSYIKRSSRAFGFTSSVARQLARCWWRSTRVNYQAKWSVFRASCHRHGHSVSRPTIPKIASFLLYLRHSLSLSYSSIASYRSMLSGVFRFVLPDLSSHFVHWDLLQSFRLERPLSASRVPPWDLSRVLSFLRGAPFEPLSSCSLRDLSRKVLFLVALATARRVGELQALSAVVSESGADLFLSYLPEFRAKAESEARPLPRSFCVRSLAEFVGDLPEELLLCPVRALRCYLSRTSSLSSRPRSLFVSPRSPSRPLSKNALSFFLRSVIAKAYSSSGLSLPSRSSSVHSSCPLSLCVLMGSRVSRLHGPFIGMLLFLPSWWPLPCLPPLSSAFYQLLVSHLGFSFSADGAQSTFP